MGTPAGQEVRPSTEGVWAAEQGLEPQLPDPESGVLPLDDSAVASVLVKDYRKVCRFMLTGASRSPGCRGNEGPPMAPPLRQGDGMFPPLSQWGRARAGA